MIIYKNPSPERIIDAINESDHKAAKWFKDQDGDIIAWRAGEESHQSIADSFGAHIYDKGLYTLPEVTQ